MPTAPPTEEELLQEPQPERTTLTDTFREKGVSAGLKAGISMMTPQSAQPGANISSGSLLTDFVEFSPVGDVKDVWSGLDMSNDLDWAERTLSLLPVLPFTFAAGAAATGARMHWKARAADNARQRAAGTQKVYNPMQDAEMAALQGQSTAPAPGGQYAGPGALPTQQDLLSETDGTLQDKRNRAAKFNELAEALTMPNHTGLMEAGDLSELSHMLAPAVDGRPNTQAFAQVRAVARQIIMEAEEGAYGDPSTPEVAELAAAQSIFMRTLRASDLGLIERTADAGEITGGELAFEIGGHQLAADHLVQFEMQARQMGLGPGSVSPTAQTRLAAVIVTPEGLRTLGGAVGETLPTTRVVQLNGSVDKKLATMILKSMDFEVITGDMAVNLHTMSQKEQLENPGRFKESITWYPRVNKSLQVLKQHTNFSMPRMAAVLSALSPRNKWGGNIVAGLHTIIRYGIPDLDPKSPQYRAIFIEAMDAGGWWDDAVANQNKTVRKELQAYGSDELIRDYFSDVDHLVSKTGTTLGMLGKDKQLNSALLLLADLPWQMVLRMAKTGNFAINMAVQDFKSQMQRKLSRAEAGDPDAMRDAVTIDVHSDKAALGMNLGIDAIGSKGTYKLKKSDLEAGWTLPNGEHITADTVAEAKAKLEATGLPLTTMVERPRGEPVSIGDLIEGTFLSVPSEAATKKYFAQAMAHQLVAEADPAYQKGSEVQSATWIPWQERNKIIDDLRKAKTMDEFKNKLYELSIFDRTILNHMEGNPDMTLTVAGITARASADLDTMPLDAAGFKKSRNKSGDVADMPIKWEMRPDGAVDVYADMSYPGVSDTLRHLVPSGFKVGVFDRMVPRQARQVADVDAHYTLLGEQLDDKGTKISGERIIFTDPDVDLFSAGNRYLVHFADRAAAEKFQNDLIATREGAGLQTARHNIQYTPPATHSNAITLDDFAAVDNLNAPGVMEQADWVAMTAAHDTRSSATNSKMTAELAKEIEKAGGTVYWTDGTSQETLSDELFVEPDPAQTFGPLNDIAESWLQGNANWDVEPLYLTSEVETARAMDIADAYDALPMWDPESAPAYEAFTTELMSQYEALVAAGYTFDWSYTDFYKNSAEMHADVRENKRIITFMTDTSDFAPEAPLIRESGVMGTVTLRDGKSVQAPLTYNDIFRAVHDIMGHAIHKNQFGPLGEENAWRVHARMFSPLARRAMTTETRGQNSWVNFGPQMRASDGTLLSEGDKGWLPPSERDFANQKTALLPERYSQLDQPGGKRMVAQQGVTAFGLPYSKAMSLAKKYGQDSIATRAGLLETNGQMSPATGQVRYGEEARSAQFHSQMNVGERQMAFAADYSQESTALPDDVDSLMAQPGKPQPRVAVRVELGGTDTGTNWEHSDKIWDMAGKANSLDRAAYLHGDLWKPKGTGRISENVSKDPAGRTQSWRTGTERNSSDTHSVVVPHRKTFEVSRGEEAVTNPHRTSKQARDLLEFDQEGNKATVDGDVEIVFRPGADIVFGAQGSILNVKADGESIREGTVFVGKDGPTQIAMGIADVGPGRVKFQLTRGKVSKLEADNPTDLYASADALGRAGVEPDQVVFKGAVVGVDKSELDFTPYDTTEFGHLGTGKTLKDYRHEHPKNLEMTEAIAAAMRRNGVAPMEGWTKVDLTLAATDAQAKIVETTIVNLIEGKFGVKIPPRIFSGEFAPGGVSSAYVTDDLNLMGAVVYGYNLPGRQVPNRGIALNERLFFLTQDAKLTELEHRVASKADPIEATIVHESAHLVQGVLYDHGLIPAWERHTSETWKELNKDLGTRRTLGTYATWNQDEFFAEAYTAVAYGETTNPVIIEYVESVMNVANADDPVAASLLWKRSNE